MKEKTRKKLQAIVKNSYSQTAKEFDLSRQKQVWPKLKEVAELVYNRASVLDLGCGNGRLLKVLDHKNPNYLGIDQEKELVEIAKKHWPKYNFLCSNIEELPNKKYDFIFLIAVIHHIPSRKKRLTVLKNLRNHLNKNGKIIISVWNLRKTRPKLVLKSYLKSLFSSQIEYGDVLFPWKKDHGKELITRYYHAFSKKELKNLVKNSGFKIKKLEEDNFNIWIIIEKN